MLLYHRYMLLYIEHMLLYIGYMLLYIEHMLLYIGYMLLYRPEKCESIINSLIVYKLSKQVNNVD